MRFLIVDTDYDLFIGWLYTQHPRLAGASFAEQHSTRVASLFSMSDFYSSNLRRLGHETWDVFANVEPMQLQWAREQHLDLETARWRFRLRRGIVPWIWRERSPEWLYPILAAQVREYRPDILFSRDMTVLDSTFLRSLRGFYRMAVGQHAATPLSSDISAYDLVISSLPNQVEHFRSQGLKAEHIRLAFEPRVLEELSQGPKRHSLVFAGALGGIHQDGTNTLEYLASRVPVTVWGYGIERLAAESPIRKCFQGQLWGRDMYQAFRDARIVFNRHSNTADLHTANNLRLYEATGVGSLLLTDFKPNLSDMFEVGKEVVAYRNAEECAELAAYYLAHDAEREAIAAAGQRRTLREHTYAQRMRELVEIIGKYV